MNYENVLILFGESDRMIDIQFSKFLHGFIKSYNSDILENTKKCKSLLLDQAKGEYKNEIRLLLQALEMGCYTTITNSNDLNITRMSLIKQLQEVYYISDNISTSLIDLLLFELRNYKKEQKEQLRPSTKEKPKKKITTKKNMSNQNISIQLPISNTNKTTIDTSAIQEFSSIISNKVNNKKTPIEKFRNTAILVYEPAFKEYKDIMEENNLKCRYKILFNRDIYLHQKNAIGFYFLFLNKIDSYYNYDADYLISFKEDNYVERHFILFNNATRYSSLSDHKTFHIEDLTKEVIMHELSSFTKEILKIIKEEQILKQGSPKKESATSSQKTQKDLFSTHELKDLFSYLSNLFDFIPEKKIKEFVRSGHYVIFLRISKENEELPNYTKKQIKDLFSHIDELLDFLPSEKINLFINSEHYETYKKLFNYLGLVYWRIS